MVLSKLLHRDVFIAVLREIYSDTILRTTCGIYEIQRNTSPVQ